MAKNTGNLNDGSDTLALARQDLYDMAKDIGYEETGDVSPISTTGGNNKIIKTDASGNAILTGGLTADGATLVDVSDANAFEVKNGSGSSMFNVDTVNDRIMYEGNQEFNFYANSKTKLILYTYSSSIFAKIKGSISSGTFPGDFAMFEINIHGREGVEKTRTVIMNGTVDDGSTVISDIIGLESDGGTSYNLYIDLTQITAALYQSGIKVELY